MRKYEDSPAPFDNYKEQGFYTVGDKHYLYKFNALLAAGKENLPAAWNFNDEIYSLVDWKKPSGRALKETYKLRAQQVREKYDYLILSYSGGSDSTTMLNAFIDNGIKIDEIWCDWPLSLIEKSGAPITPDRHFDNYYSEYYLNTHPRLKKISAEHPNIKIHVSDSLENPKVEDAEDTSYLTSIPIQIQATYKQRYIYRYVTELALKLNKKVGILLGVDKPVPFLNKNNMIGMLIPDNPILMKSDVTPSSYRNVEYFYWSPDFPQLLVDQGHSVISYLRNNPNDFYAIENTLRTLKGSHTDRSLYYNILVEKICYPDWDFGFQTNKQPFGRTICLRPVLKSFWDHDFVQVYRRRFLDDYNKLSNPNFHDAGEEVSPTPLQNFFKFYPIVELSQVIRNVS